MVELARQRERAPAQGRMTAAPARAPARLRAVVRGAVQGVGFRPFVYRIATALDLAGWVKNSPAGVVIEVEGEKAVLDAFLLRLAAEAPPRAVIQSLEFSFLDPRGYAGFAIRESDDTGAAGGARSPRHRDLRRVPRRDLRSRSAPPSLSVHQLHALRAAFHDHRGPALRPAGHRDEGLPPVR